MSDTLTDRSRQITYQECPRRRYLEYHYPTKQGRIGIRLVRLNIPLATGIYTHRGLQELLKGRPIDKAVKLAVNEYWTEINKRGLLIKTGEDGAFVADEQTAWVEGTLRAYEKVRLPLLLDQYEIVDVETEIEVGLNESITMMTRRDAKLRDKETGEFYIQSYKTAATFDDRTQAQGEHDVQGLSEAYAAEVHDGQRIAGIRMEYLLKGIRKQYPEDSGNYVQYSPLIRGMVKHGITPGDDEYGWKREWKDEMGKTRKLDYRTWAVFNAWQSGGGVKAWIDLLATGTVQPQAGPCLEQQFVQPQPYCRQEDDLRNWYQQTVNQEERIANALAFEPDVERAYHQDWLNQYFPQHKSSCDWPSPCQFIDICFASRENVDPLGSGNYEPRVPHHKREQELVQITGGG